MKRYEVLDQVLVTTSSANMSRSANLRYASTAGMARNKFESTRERMNESDIIGTLRFGAGTAYINAAGEINPEKGEEVEVDGEDEPVFQAFDIVDLAYSMGIVGSVPLNKTVSNVAIPCGVCLIVGGGGVGKTPLAWGLASAGRTEDDAFAVCRIGEPIAGYISNDKDAAARILLSMYHSSDVVVDSIKDLLSSSKGAAMKSGLSRDALSVMSAWSELACAMGTTLYVPVNPSVPDDEVLELLAEAARSNATCTIMAKDTDTWEFFSRTGEGMPRSRGTFSTTYTSTGWIEIRSSSVEPAKANGNQSVTVKVDPNVWNDAMRRAIEIGN